jgi:hypothetical protein
MKALLYDRDESRQTLEIRETEKPVPKKNEVLVGVHAVSIKDWDLRPVQNKGVIRVIGRLWRSEKIVGSDIAGASGKHRGRSETIPTRGRGIWRLELPGSWLWRVR